MSSKKKQGASAPTDKKKFSLFNLGKSKGSEKTAEKNEPSAAAAEITNTAVTAAVLHSNETDKPSTSNNKGQLKKITKFFKKGHNTHAKKTSKKANEAVNPQQQLSEKDPANTQGAQSSEGNNDMPLKIDGSEVVASELRRENAATKIQAIFRGHNQRRKYLQKRQNVIKVEAMARGFLSRKHVASMKSSPEVTEVTEEEKEHTVDKIQSENLISFS